MKFVDILTPTISVALPSPPHYCFKANNKRNKHWDASKQNTYTHYAVMNDASPANKPYNTSKFYTDKYLARYIAVRNVPSNFCFNDK